MSNIKKQDDVKRKNSYIITLIKYFFSLIIIFLGAKGPNWYLFFGLVELSIVMLLSNIALRSKHIGWLVNSVLLLLLNIQMVFLFMSNSYIVLIFLDNIDSIHGLSGRAITYSIIALVTVAVSFLPVNRFRTHLLLEVPALIVLVLGGYYANIITGGYFSPFSGYKNLYSQYRAEKDVQKK